MLIKRFRQHLRNRTGIRTFNLETVQRKNRLPVSKNRHGRRRRWNARQQFTHTRHSFDIRACENGCGLIGPVRVVQR